MSILQLTFSAAMFLLALLACVRSGHAVEVANDMPAMHEKAIATAANGAPTTASSPTISCR